MTKEKCWQGGDSRLKVCAIGNAKPAACPSTEPAMSAATATAESFAHLPRESEACEEGFCE